MAVIFGDINSILTVADTFERQRTTSLEAYYHLYSFNNSSKYNPKASTGVKNPSAESKNKYRLPAPLHHIYKPNRTIVAFGDGMLSSSMKRTKSAPIRLIKKAFKKSLWKEFGVGDGR
ncbi:hypothetical protein INT47_001523 [Mucor saturninus]|uniref:Uncharacterized protein n=1 Tax=Mucor saturninus TaxID=64648 RepID=A0A8H7UWC0_9FUNG|nr:hypothetical protein INT47_001523 [Mucor saturninus]